MASSATIDAFRALDENSQRAALGRMSPEAKQALLAGLKPPEAEAEPKPDSVLGGFGRRAAESVKGLGGMFAPPEGITEKAISLTPALPLYRLAKGVYEGGAKAGGQAAEQAKQGIQSMRSDPVAGGLRMAQAGVTAASALNPLATGAVTNINEKEAEGRNREAIGGAGFDTLTLLLGSKTGKKLSPTKQLNKLAYATNAESIRPLQHVQEDIAATTAKNGPPRTVGQLLDTMQQTSDKFENTFNTHLQGMEGQQINLQPIADALKAKAAELPRAASGEAAELLHEAKLYDGQVTTPRELNADRMYRYSNLKGYYNKGMTGQMAAMRTSAQNMADKIVYDGAKDVLYGEMEKQFPGTDFRALKQKQGSMLEIMDRFEEHVKNLEAKQAKFKGAPLGDKQTVSASVGQHGVLPRLHGLLPKRGPLTKANAAVGVAFGPTAAASARRAAILSLPVSSLVTGRPPTIPPPPSEEVEGPQQ